MPRPVLAEGLKPEMRAGTAARAIINAKLEETARYVKPALKGDFDGVHDLRVAIKRLREALRLFGQLIRKRRREPVFEMAQELNDALGQVRERDVLIRDAQRVIESAPQTAELLGGLLEQWQQEREQRLKVFRDAWKRLDGSGLFLDETRRAARAAHRRSQPLNDLSLESFAYCAITARAAEVMTDLAQARGSDDPHLLHMLRIATKKLRYAIEPFLPVFPALQASYDVASDIQESLGLTHDSDVLLAAMEDYLRSTGQIEVQPAVEVLAMLRADRDERYARARESVNRLDSESWRRDLLDAVD